MKDQENNRNRLEMMADRALEPGSLVGSFFHGTADRSWQGCVVAEVAPQVYLVELFEWIAGSSSEQKLVRLEEMLGWRFYDDAKWMNNAYDNGVRQQWEAQRGRGEEAGDDDDG